MRPITVLPAVLVLLAIQATTAVSPVRGTEGFKLPWTAGQTYTVTQTWAGQFSHSCPSYTCYAYDFGLPTGTDVRAAASGRVTLATGNDHAGGCSSTYAGRGNRVKIQHADGSTTVYLHLNDIVVSLNQQVQQGQLIGHSGATGYACGPHLHFQRDRGDTSVQVYFDEYKDQQLRLNQRVTSQNGAPPATPSPTATPAGTAGLDFDIAVPAAWCATESANTNCAVAEEFTLEFRLNTLPPDFSYLAYEWEVQLSGVEVVAGSLDQVGSGTWPDCGPLTRAPEQPETVAACSVSGAASTYTGVMLRVDLRCPSPSSTGTITLVNSLFHTDVIDGSFVRHHEGGDESIAVRCPDAPTATPTSTPTPTPTATFTPTPTSTPRPIYGDANCDNTVSPIDATIVLQHGAGMIFLCDFRRADSNRDGRVNPVDATLILQFSASVIGSLPP
jgi:hypothetical protein